MISRETVNIQATQDFDKARTKEFFSRVLHFLRPQKNQLLNFNEVKTLLRPNAEIYRGMQTVNIDSIVGSEGRYRDFNAVFLPKNEHMRSRWESVDKAHIQDVILPPIKLYKVGEVYFVRDGNHRVSVARSQGVQAIDAEVTEFKTDYKLEQNENLEELRDKLLRYERERFVEQTHLDQIIPLEHLEFSDPGRFDEILQHIQGHKYYINLNIAEEISFQDAALSWYYNVFLPIIQTISHEGVITRFPGRTKADLYIWIVKHWDELKGKYGEKVSLKDAALDFSHRKGKSLWSQFLGLFRK
ncbi:MAG: transcriptional regulator [Spirochaetales bacterium]|nr:transcriptional regulator [Spirochaetales bacterium]